MAVSAVIEDIRTKGHWDVAIRPEPFRPDLVSYGELDTILSQAVVRLRGWPVPFIDNHEPLMRHQDWIGQDIGIRGVPREEAWRFFTSGQFAQLRVISADLGLGRDTSSKTIGQGSVIEIWEILFYLTELIELAARLAFGHAGSDQVTIDIRFARASGSPTSLRHLRAHAS